MTHPLVDRLAAAIENVTGIDPGESGLDADGAYEVQDQLIARLGGRVEAIKLGLTSRAKQAQMNVDEPIYGALLSGSLIEPGGTLACDQLIQPRAEPEIAFLVDRDLEGPAVSATHVIAATAAVMPAIDILDSRYSGYRFSLADVIADNASSARYALGDPVPVDGIDLRLVGCAFNKNGETIATAAGAAVLGHPAGAVAWYVRKLAERDRGLAAGTIVLAGALTAATPVSPGDTIGVEIDRVGSLELACR